MRISLKHIIILLIANFLVFGDFNFLKKKALILKANLSKFLKSKKKK